MTPPERVGVLTGYSSLRDLQFREDWFNAVSVNHLQADYVLVPDLATSRD